MYKNHKIWLIGLLTMITVIMLLGGCGEESLKENNGISMEEVVELALAEGAKYYDNLQLTEIHSYDNDVVRSIDAGKDGKREWWYVNLANEQKNYVSMLFQNREIMLTMNYDSNGNGGLFTIDEVKITCEEAVQKARELGIRGGNPEVEEEWVSGYNFQLSYGSLTEAPDNRFLMLGVIGISENGNLARVYFNAATGEIVLAEEEVEHADGSLEYRRITIGEQKVQETDNIVSASQSVESTESEKSLSEVAMEDIFALAKKYLVDPEKLMEAVSRRDDSPWSNLQVYEQEEWEAMMTERYGDAWKEW